MDEKLMESGTEICGTCRFFGGEEPRKFYGMEGVCRRYAPRALQIDPNRLDEQLIIYWPRTDDDDWCGDWKQASDEAISWRKEILERGRKTDTSAVGVKTDAVKMEQPHAPERRIPVEDGAASGSETAT